jgi:ubiquinone/menaquinone biosynthesis C-methylase UbiE
VNRSDAVNLLAAAVPRGPGVWADLGAGHGTFTRALGDLLGPEGTISAVDREPGAIAALERLASRAGARVTPVHADFTHGFELPGLAPGSLDGMLLANALHYVREAGAVLARLAEWLRPGGRVVVIEYDGRKASPWVPYPVPAVRLPDLVAVAGLTPPVITGTRRSAFGGTMYVAVAERARR